MGSKEIGLDCLKFLYENKDLFSIEIKAVFSNNRMLYKNSTDIKSFAQKNKIPFFLNQEALQKLPPPDYMISVQYHEIINSEFLQKVKILPLNLHMAPLPKYRGCNQFSFAIFNKEEFFGTTLHVMDPKIDHGDILFQKVFKIHSNFAYLLYKQTVDESFKLFKEKINLIFSGHYPMISQSSLDVKPSFYLRSDIENIKIIKSDMPIEEQKLRFRSTFFPPFDPPSMIKGNEKIYLDMDWYNNI